MGGSVWVLVVIVAAMVAIYAIRKYHQRELARIETAQLELEDYVKIAMDKITFSWQCPHDGTPLLTAEALNAHQDPARSACAQAVERAARAAELAELRGAGMTAEQVPHGDAWPPLGADDEPAEIES